MCVIHEFTVKEHRRYLEEHLGYTNCLFDNQLSFFFVFEKIAVCKRLIKTVQTENRDTVTIAVFTGCYVKR